VQVFLRKLFPVRNYLTLGLIPLSFTRCEMLIAIIARFTYS